MTAVDRGEPGERRWYVRLAGEQKATFTVWFTLGQRTLHYETYVMPAPVENQAQFYEHLLRRNLKLYGAAFAVGAEDAIFLVGQVGVRGPGRGRAGPDPGLAVRLGRAVLPPGHAHRLRQHLQGLIPARRLGRPSPADPPRPVLFRNLCSCAAAWRLDSYTDFRRAVGSIDFQPIHAWIGRHSGAGNGGAREGTPLLAPRLASRGMTRLALVGGGRMGEALLGGLLAGGWAEPADLVVVEPVASRRETAGRAATPASA